MRGSRVEIATGTTSFRRALAHAAARVSDRGKGQGCAVPRSTGGAQSWLRGRRPAEGRPQAYAIGRPAGARRATCASPFVGPYRLTLTRLGEGDGDAAGAERRGRDG